MYLVADGRVWVVGTWGGGGGREGSRSWKGSGLRKWARWVETPQGLDLKQSQDAKAPASLPPAHPPAPPFLLLHIHAGPRHSGWNTHWIGIGLYGGGGKLLWVFYSPENCFHSNAWSTKRNQAVGLQEMQMTVLRPWPSCWLGFHRRLVLWQNWKHLGFKTEGLFFLHRVTGKGIRDRHVTVAANNIHFVTSQYFGSWITNFTSV